jgi:hypothetical protein
VPAALVRSLADPEPGVRRAAARAVGGYDDPGVAAPLERATHDPDRETALRAAEALVARGVALTGESSWAVETARITTALGAPR